jgi:hypothetical protein
MRRGHGRLPSWSVRLFFDTSVLLAAAGQLAAYCGARRDLPIVSAWIHFAAAAGLMQVAW